MAADRIADELYRVLAGRPSRALELLADLGLLAAVLPELEALGQSARSRIARRLEMLEQEPELEALVVPVGGGSHSDRSMRLGGIVMRQAADEVIEKESRQAVVRIDP